MPTGENALQAAIGGWSVDDVDTEMLENAPRNIIDFNEPTNTQKAYDPKQKQFKEFCDYKFANLTAEQGRYQVTPKKVKYFMFYQAFRNKVPRGSRNAGFRPLDYAETLHKYSIINPDEKIADPASGIDHSSMIQYKAALRKLWHRQYEMNMNSYPWELIWTTSCDRLFVM
jgi:hypothetical protein